MVGPRDDPESETNHVVLPPSTPRSGSQLAPILAAVGAGCVVLVAALISITLVYNHSVEAFKSEFRENLIRLAEAAAAVVDGDRHREITSPAQQNNAEYQQTVAPLRAMLGQIHGVKYIYTAIQKDGQIYFVLDSANPGDADGDGRDDQAKIMEAYVDPDPAMVRCFETQAAGAASAPYEDDWGVFITGYAWFHDRQGTPVGIVGVDVAAQEYQGRLQSMRNAAWMAAPPSILIALFTSVGVYLALRVHFAAQCYRVEKEAELQQYADQLFAAARESDQARQRAEEANQAKSQFLANMSHELRTPLTAILGFSEELCDESSRSLAASDREMLITIRRNASHLLEVINDILDLAKIEANKLAITPTPTDIVVHITETVHSLLHQAKSKGISLELDWRTAVPAQVYCDPLRLRQILLNLLGNAIKFTLQGSVRVAVSITPGPPWWLEIEIRDTGIGMSPDQMQNLFQPFTQADSSMTRRFGGTGLGLAISRRLAQQMDGEIRVQSESGIGSTFTVRFPMEADQIGALVSVPAPSSSIEPPPPPAVAAAPILPAPASGNATPANTAPPPLADLRILLAEDGIDNQKLIAMLLRKAGAVVQVVENGDQAVRALTEHASLDGPLIDPSPFDILLLDMQMPVMDGYAAATLLRAKHVQIPVIALTAHAMDHDREKCLAAGCDDFATKPVSRDKLIAAVSKWRPQPCAVLS